MTTTSPPVPGRSTSDWIRRSFFKNWWSGLITIVLIPIVAFGAYRAFLFFFVNGQWEAVTRNLTLFMQGTFPRDEQWRLIAQILIFALAFGIGAGTSRASARDRAQDAGLTFEEETIGRDSLSDVVTLVAFIGLLLYFASVDDAGNLLNPFLLVGAAVVVAILGFQAKRLPRGLRNLGWLFYGDLAAWGFSGRVRVRSGRLDSDGADPGLHGVWLDPWRSVRIGFDAGWRQIGGCFGGCLLGEGGLSDD